MPQSHEEDKTSKPVAPAKLHRLSTRDLFLRRNSKRSQQEAEPEHAPLPPPHKGVLPETLFLPSEMLGRPSFSDSTQRDTPASPVSNSGALDSRLQELKRLLLLHEMDLQRLQSENKQLRERLCLDGRDAHAADRDFQQALFNAGPISSSSVEMEPSRPSPTLLQKSKEQPDASLQQVCHASWLSQQEVSESLADGSLAQLCPNVQAEKNNADKTNDESGNCTADPKLQQEAPSFPVQMGESATETSPLQQGNAEAGIEKEAQEGNEASDDPVLSQRQDHSMRKFFRPGVDRRNSSMLAVEGSALERIVYGHTFESACGVVILMNTVLIAIELQYDGIQNGFELGVGDFDKDAESTWPHAYEVFRIFDIAFNACFCLELIVRTLAMKTRAVFSAWMWFDTFIVIMGLLDLFGSGGGLGFDPTMIRVVRLVRLVRLVKIFKAMSHFDSLFLLIKAIQASWIALTWSFLLLGGVQIAVGLFLCQILQGHIENEEITMDSRQEVFRYFGTFTRTMITMFEITLANWVPSCRLLIEDVNEWFIMFYIVYRCMFCFAVIKVIAAVFITETNRVLESDDELTVMKSNRTHKAYISRLYHIFRSIDVDGNGSFDWDEFQAALKEPRTSAWLATLDFELHDLEKLFWLLDNGEGKILIEDFVGKVSQLKGHAKTIDVLAMLKLAHRIDQTLKQRQQLPFDMLLADSASTDLRWGSQRSTTRDLFFGSPHSSPIHHVEKSSHSDGRTVSPGGNSLQTHHAGRAPDVGDSQTSMVDGTSLRL